MLQGYGAKPSFCRASGRTQKIVGLELFCVKFEIFLRTCTLPLNAHETGGLGMKRMVLPFTAVIRAFLVTSMPLGTLAWADSSRDLDVAVAAFAQTPILVEGADLSAVLQTEESKKACDLYWETLRQARPQGRFWTAEEIRSLTNETVRVLCGKHIFTYGTPTTNAAVPESYLRGAMVAWPDLVGESFQAAGLIPNPDDPGFAVGMGVTRSSNPLTQQMAGNKMRHAAVCSMCHFSQLPDGRYSYGLPNDRVRFGNLAFAFSYPVWTISQDKDDPTKWLPAVHQRMLAMREQAKEVGDPAVVMRDLSFIPRQVPVDDAIRRLLSLPDIQLPDQRDFLFEDAGRGPVFYIALGTKQKLSLAIPNLWDIDSPEGREDEMDRFRLGAFVHSPSLETHVVESVLIGAGVDKYGQAEWTIPVTDFIRRMRSPVSLAKRDVALYAKGQDYFQNNCSGCHTESNGGSGKLIPAAAMRLDERYTAPYILHVEPSNKNSAKNFSDIRKLYEKLHPDLGWDETGVRVRRVKGVWARGHLTSNGAVRGLDHLLCLNGRTRDFEAPLGTDSDAGHGDLCLNHSKDNRLALREFLSHWD
jgi:hypothetical protein